MKYLLDTQIIIWLANMSTDKISDKAMSIIRNQSNRLFLSIVSLWEYDVEWAW